MSDKSFKIELPEQARLRAASRTPVKIRNAKLSVVKVIDLDEKVSLPAGYYAAEIALPDGSEYEAAFEVPKKGKMKDVKLSLAEDQDALAAAWQQRQQQADTAADDAAFEISEDADDELADKRSTVFESIHFDFMKTVRSTDFDLGQVLPNFAGIGRNAVAGPGRGSIGGLEEFGRGLVPGPSVSGTELSQVTIRHRPDPGGQLLPASPLERKLVEKSNFSLPSTNAPPARISMIQALPGVETQAPQSWAETAGRIVIDPVSIPARKNLWLRLAVEGSSDRNIALPVSYNEGAAFELESENRSWRFVLPDPDANAALGYLRHKKLTELTWLAAQDGPIWNEMFNADLNRPIAGTIGAYALLLTGGMERGKDRWTWDWSVHLQWSQQLVRNQEAPADALAIHGELLARQGRYDEAMESFWEMTERGFPVFSIGLRLMVDRLLSCRSKKVSGFDPGKINAMIERFGTLSNYVDFEQPVLSYTTNENGTYSAKARQREEEAVRQ